MAPSVQPECARLPAGPVSGRLNDFQRTMLQWNGLHPYNAVHVLRIEGSIGRERFEDRVRHILTTAGLTNYSVEEGRGRYRYEGGEADCEAAYLGGGEEPLKTVHHEMERQLNAPFPCEGRFQPFRFFLVPAGDGCFVGLAYFHAAADADSVGRLLFEVVAACFDETPGPLRDRSLSERMSSRIPGGSPWSAPGRVRSAYRRFQALRRCHRPPAGAPDDTRNAWFGLALDEPESSAVLARTKRLGVTVNDLSLASLLQALVPVTSARFDGHRTHLAAGCVVNLRHDLPESRRKDFGLYLGTFSVIHPLPPGTGLEALVGEVRRQTAEVKRRKLYLASRLEFRLNRFFFLRQRSARRGQFYRKVFPAWGSITNFKVDLGSGGLGWRAKDYLRAVSAGAALPLVVGITGFEGRLNFGFSFRPGLIPEVDAREIARRFLALLCGKEENP